MRRIKIISMIMSISILLAGCSNRQILDTTWKYDKAIICIGTREIEIDVKSWNDYEDTTVQITDKDGSVYLTDMKNVVLIKK